MTISAKSTPLETTDLPLENFGVSTLAEFLDDRVIYRSLEPLDKRVPGLKRSRMSMGLHTTDIPRKLDRDYAKAAVWFLEQFHEVTDRPGQIDELLFIGDTLSGDGQAFLNIQERSGWRSSCLIVDEKPNEAPTMDLAQPEGVVQGNRWSQLGEWLAALVAHGFKLDASTAVVIDLDKTAIGARGRNDQAIDKARLTGIYRTMDSVLGDNFNREAFETDYRTLNQSRFHIITGDNQDYLSYICLMLNGCVTTLDEVLTEVENGSLRSFQHLIRWIEILIKNGHCASESLRQAHEAVLMSVQAGDPTPFKRFRREELIATLEHMNNMADDTPAADRLDTEITITQEVREAALWLAKRGCLVTSMSDKPDEASRPDRRSRGESQPIHRAATHVVGTSIQPTLDAIA